MRNWSWTAAKPLTLVEDPCKETRIMTTRREALVLLAGSAAGVALPIGFSAGASMDTTMFRREISDTRLDT